jgi:GT2 family glycosyltransferase/glycosyltransferase involved in cell wall biosynthesis
MDSQKAADIFDAYYFAHDCGVPYERNDHWLHFFDKIAERIVCEIQPRTVLDAGCAMGFLVEKLRERGVEAYGVDISEYAIAHVHEDIKPYCWVGSITEPFPQKYDLIVNIEVVEHMSPWDAEKAVENFIRHSDDILFSSTPFDYKEVTHFNVRPPEHWAILFARHNFYRDIDFDASFVTPWAVRLRYRRDAMSRLVGEYERKFWVLWKENTDLRSLGLEMQDQIEHRDNLIKLKDDHIDLISKNMDEQISFRDEEIRKRNAAMDKAMYELNAVIHQQNVRLVEKEEGLVALGAYIEELRKFNQRTINALATEKAQDAAAHKAYSASMEAELAQKNEHISYLEDLIRQIESGQVMKVMRTLQVLRQQGPGAALQSYRQQNQPTQSNTPTQPSMLDSYQAWIAANEPDADALKQQRTEATSFPYRPRISIITPVYNPQPAVLRETIESVLAQTYEQWEWYLVDGNSDRPGVKEVLAAYDKQDSRIHVLFLESNLGIAGNSNQALKKIQGEFVALLDHDDLLAPNMLYEVVRLLNEQPDVDIVYYDEDKIAADGRTRNSPWFKPAAWSPDLLLSTNYLMHGVMRRTLIDDVGSFNSVMDGAQDWDLTLRCASRTKNIQHIPKVLYHWRQVEGSAARDANAKPWAFEAQARCIAAHLKRLGVQEPRVIFPSLGRVRVIWPVSYERVSIIIPTRDKPDLLRACLTSIREKTNYPNYEIILVDTGSTQAETHTYYQELEAEKRIRIIDCPGAFNFSASNNLGARYASGSLLLFLNNDTEVLEADWLDELVGWAERPAVGVVGCKLIRPDKTIQHAGLIMGVEGHGSHIFDGLQEDHYGPFGSSEWYRNYQAVTGACMMMRRDVFEAVGGFDDVYQVGFSDIAICLSARQHGYRVVYTPFARLLHHEGGTRGFDVPPADVLRAYFHMLPLVQDGDPFFSANLSYAHRQPTIARAEETARKDRLRSILELFDLVQPNARFTADNMLATLSDEASREEQQVQHDTSLDKRILFVSHDLSLSGAPLILSMLAKHLVAHGYSVTVLSPNEGPLYEHYMREHIEVILEPAVIDDARVTYSLLKEYGVVIVNTIVAWRSVHAARAYPRPCIWWIHESSYGQQFMRTHEHVLAALQAANKVVFPSRATADLYARFGSKDHFVPIHTGLDLAVFDDHLNTFAREESRFVVVCVASIEPRKGQDILLRSLGEIPEDLRQRLDVYLVGRILDWDFHKELQKLVRLHPNVHIVGEVAHQRVTSYIRSADVFVLPSRDEALPISLLEAMSYGKVVIASNAGGTAEVVIHGEHGLIFEVGDYIELSRQLQRLAQNPELMHELERNARNRFESYLTMERFGREMVNVIKRVTLGMSQGSGQGMANGEWEMGNAEQPATRGNGAWEMENEGQPGDTAMEKGESGVMEKGESGMENEGQPGDAAIEHAEGNRDYAGLPDSLDAEMQGTRRAEEEGMEPGECRMQNAE